MADEHHESTADLPSQDAAPDRLSREDMLDQLQVMARQIAGDAPPALREASAVAAELAAITARGTGPVARTLGELTDDASVRFAERMEAYAAGVRDEGADGDQHAPDDADVDGVVGDEEAPE